MLSERGLQSSAMALNLDFIVWKLYQGHRNIFVFHLEKSYFGFKWRRVLIFTPNEKASKRNKHHPPFPSVHTQTVSPGPITLVSLTSTTFIQHSPYQHCHPAVNRIYPSRHFNWSRAQLPASSPEPLWTTRPLCPQTASLAPSLLPYRF